MTTTRLLLVALLACVLTSAPAYADDAAEWRAALLKPGNGEDIWKGVFDDEVGTALDPEESLRRTLEPLFAPGGPLPGLAKEHRERLLAFVISYVLQPTSAAFPTSHIPFADAFVLELAGEEKLVGMVRQKLNRNRKTGRQPAWDRLMRDTAGILYREEVKPGDVPLVEAAIDLLSRGSEGAEIEAIAAIAEHARRKKGGEQALARVSEVAYIDALAALLGHKFPTFVDADRWLMSQVDILHDQESEWRSDQVAADRAFVTLLRRVIKRPSIDRQNAIRYGKWAISHAAGPEELAPLYTTECPYPELRVAALQRAKALGPDASLPWIELITGLLDQEAEPAVLDALLRDVLDEEPYSSPSEHSEALVDAILVRLQSPKRGDTVAQRTLLVRSLTGLGTLRHFEGALVAMRDAVLRGGSQDEELVYAELLRKAGQAEGANVASIVAHYFPLEGATPSDRIRQSVADALGQKAIRENEIQGGFAAEVLRLILAGAEQVPAHLLTGLGLPKAMARETSGAVRRVALESLRYYPDADTITLLRTLAQGDDSAEAMTAIDTLGQILESGSEAYKRDALAALQSVIEADPARPDEILIKAIDVLAKLPGDAPVELQTTRGQIIETAVQSGSKTDAVKLAAATVAAKRALRPALEGVADQWRKLESKEWYDVLDALVFALAADEHQTYDQTLEDHIRANAASDRFDYAVRLTQRLFEKTSRSRFAHVRGDLFLSRGRDDSADPVQRKHDFDEAIAAFGGEVKVEGLDGDARQNAFRQLYKAHMDRAELETPGAGQVEFFLGALKAAADSKDKALAEVATIEGGVRPKLNGLVDQLDDDQKNRKASADDQLDQLIG